MVKGQTYDKQLFNSAAFRHFVNIFLNKESGVTKGCELTKDTINITVGKGMFCILGGFLEETTGTANEIPSEAGYYKLIYEIDLSKTNDKDNFNQGSYKFVKNIGDYPVLTQEDLDNGGNVYQFEFCQFRITETGLQDFLDTRKFIDYGIYVKKNEKASITVWNASNQEISKGTGFAFKFNKFDNVGEYFEITNNNKIKVLKDCRVYISSKVFIENSAGTGYVLTAIKVNDNKNIANSLEEITGEYFTNCNNSGVVYDLKQEDLITMTIDYTSDSGGPQVRGGRENSSITIIVV